MPDRGRRAALAIAAGLALAFPAGSHGGSAQPRVEATAAAAAVDTERDCGLLPPPRELPRDTGVRVDYDILLLLDGVSTARAQQLVAQAQRSYTPLDVRLRPTMRAVSFPGEESLGDVISSSRRLYGGAVPAGYDTVYTLTAKNLRGGFGVVSCVGGVRSANRAFGVSEDAQGRRPTVSGDREVPVWPWGDITGRVLAHELGHLLGGEHNFANCVEGGFTDGVPSPCTVMDGSLTTSYRFSLANRLTVRATAVRFAAP